MQNQLTSLAAFGQEKVARPAGVWMDLTLPQPKESSAIPFWFMRDSHLEFGRWIQVPSCWGKIRIGSKFSLRACDIYKG
jgi:hypothetical protein